MKRSEQRILTTHVGSLIRPKALLDAGKDRDGARRDAHEQELTRSVAEVVSRQAKAGIDVVNDGEFGKSGWANYSLERLSGFEPRPDKLYPAVWLGRDRIRFADFMAAEFPRGTVGTPGHACIGPIAYHDHASVRRDLANLKAAAAAAAVEEAFFTAVAPASVGYDAANEHYASERDYVFAIAKALREEYLEVHKAGFVLQVDDAVLANMYDHLVAQSPQRYREWAELRIDALNHALEGIPEDRRASLFTPFEQVDGSATRTVGGLGLGLSFVRRVAEDFGLGVVVDAQFHAPTLERIAPPRRIAADEILPAHDSRGNENPRRFARAIGNHVRFPGR